MQRILLRGLKVELYFLSLSRYSHQVHCGGARWVWLDQQLGGDLTARLDLDLNYLQPERQRWG